MSSELHSSSKPLRSRLPKRTPLGLLALLLLVGGDLLVWRVFTPANDSPPPRMAQGLPPTPVQTDPLQRGERVRRIQLLGQVEATKNATVVRPSLAQTIAGA